MPIRSHAIPFVYLKIPMTLFKAISLIARRLIGIDLLSSYSLLVFPRVVMCLISFVNDLCVYRICNSYNLKYDIRLLALASSGVMLTFGIRSFSNTIEMALNSVILCLVSECMILSNTVIYQKEYLEERYDEAETIGDRVKYFKMRMTLPSHSYSKCAILSTLCVIGIFNRPTFVMFGLPTIFFWMIRGFGSRSVTFLDFNLRMLLFIVSGLPAFLVIIVIDSLYYGYLSLAQIYIMDISIENFLVTPVNFIRYNIDPDNTAEHGEHPKWLHMLINIPLLYNVLGVIAVFTFGSMFYKFCKKEFQNLPQTQSFVSLMTGAIFVPILLLSLFNHQEPRFIIPVTVPLIMLHSPKLIVGVNITNVLKESQWNFIKQMSNRVNFSISGKFLLKSWYAINIVFTLFFGFIHQGGVIQLADHFSKHHQMQPATTQIHLVTSHVYNIPESLFILPHSSMLYTNGKNGQKYKIARRFFIHEYGGLELEEMFKKLKRLTDAAEVRAKVKKIDYEMFVAVPTSKALELNQILLKYHAVFTYTVERVFYPHLSTEAFPNFHHIHPCETHHSDDASLDDTCKKEIDEDYLLVASLTQKLTFVAQQFGLVLYKVEVKQRNYSRVKSSMAL